MTRSDLLAYRRSLGRTPPLRRMTVSARGLRFAVWTTPPVAGTPPLLIVNGGLIFDHALLWPALSPLAAGRQLILYDQRGRGATTAPADPLSARIEDDAADVGALRRALAVRQWDLLGHSFGGGIALLAAARDGAATRRLVLVNAIGATSAWMTQLHAAVLARVDPPRRQLLEELHPRLVEPDAAVHSAHARAAYPAWFADRAFGSALAPPEGSSLTGAAVAARLRREGYDWRDRLRALSTPTIVVHGAEDALPASVARELAELLPRARAVILAHAGHMPFWEAPGPFFDVVGAFLAGARADPPLS